MTDTWYFQVLWMNFTKRKEGSWLWILVSYVLCDWFTY